MDFHAMSAISIHLPPVNFCKKTLRSSLQAEGAANVLMTPVVVDFGRLLKSTNKSSNEVVPGIANTDLLHAAASLYGISLSEVTNDIIYPTLCEKWSKSVLMILDEQQAEARVRKRLMTSSNKTDKDIKVEPTTQQSRSLCDQREKIQKLEEADQTVDIFSDDDCDDDDGDDDDDDEDNFMNGVDAFLQSVDKRREAQQNWMKKFQSGETTQPSPPLGVENRLVACMTFERSYERPGEKVVQLTLIAVRKKYRGLGIGSYLIKHVMDPSITGGSDVIVVNADHNAVDFFERHGFTDDVILNSCYAHIGDVWFNSKRMCYMEAFSQGHQQAENYFNLREMELQISLWKERSVQAYQQFATIVQRMRREILTLHARIELQDESAVRLRRQLDERSVQLEQVDLRRRIGNLQNAIEALHDKDAGESIVTSSSALDVCSSSSSETAIAEFQPTKDDNVSKLPMSWPEDDDVTLTSEVDDDIRLLAKFADAGFETTIPSTSADQFPNLGDGWRQNAPSSQNGCTSKTLKSLHINHPLTSGCVNQKRTDLTVSETPEDDRFNQTSTDTTTTAPAGTIPAPNAGCGTSAGSVNPQSGAAPSLEEEIQSLFLHEIKHCFLVSISDAQSSPDDANVHDVTPASLPLGITTRFNQAVTSSRDPDIVATLYFCGSSQRSGDPDSFKRILTRGFELDDFAESDYGKGLHFSRHARCAAHFSPSGQIIVAKVSLGRTQTVTAKDPGRKQPPDGFDSILTQGRFSTQGHNRLNVTSHSEYVVFRHDQAIPLAVIHYTLLR